MTTLGGTSQTAEDAEEKLFYDLCAPCG